MNFLWTTWAPLIGANGTLKWHLARVLSLVAGETGATDFALERPLAVGLQCLLTLQLLQ